MKSAPVPSGPFTEEGTAIFEFKWAGSGRGYISIGHSACVVATVDRVLASKGSSQTWSQYTWNRIVGGFVMQLFVQCLSNIT